MMNKKCPNCNEMSNNTRKQDILDWIQENNKQHITINNIVEEFNIGRALAWKYLDKLETEGYLFKHTVGKKVNYCNIENK